MIHSTGVPCSVSNRQIQQDSKGNKWFAISWCDGFNTCIEAIACQTPVVAFDIDEMPDIISHQQTGYLVDSFDTRELATGILWVNGSLEKSD